jgi:hypothetical protein
MQVDCFEYIQLGRNFGTDYQTCQISATPNAELVISNFVRDVYRCRATDACQLIAEVLVECLDPDWQVHDRLALIVEDDIAAVDARLLGRLDASVCQVFVGRVERVIDHEVLSLSVESPEHVNITEEEGRIPAGLRRDYPNGCLVAALWVREVSGRGGASRRSFEGEGRAAHVVDVNRCSDTGASRPDVEGLDCYSQSNLRRCCS